MASPKSNCRWCAAEGKTQSQGECYAHCHSSSDGKHDPDMGSVRIADEGEGDYGVILDFDCRACEVTGSVRVDRAEIRFQ